MSKVPKSARSSSTNGCASFVTFLDIVGTLAKGVGFTTLVTFLCAATALVFGLGLAMVRRLGAAWLVAVLDTLVFVLRGIPVLVLLFIVFFGLPGIGLDVQAIPAMMLSLGLISGAYLSEVFRGALQAVDGNELLAAQASGLGPSQILREIELPQMFRFAVPGMINELTTVLKYSPFAYTVGIPEITKQAMALASTTMRGLEIYAAIGLLYFAIYVLMLVVLRQVERHFSILGFAQEQEN
jgi:polar amino acid transport system permease protein